MKEKITDQNPSTFAHVINQATSQETWKTYFCTHNIDKDIPSRYTVFEGLIMPKACAKIIQYSCSLQPQTNTQPPITGEITNTKYIGINKFFGENKENNINWLDVRNIPDNTVAQNNILCTINCKKQNKKWQQFPLIGETAAGNQGNKKQIKNTVLYPVCRPHAKPGGLPAHTCAHHYQPVPHPVRRMGKLSKGET
ncbi:hypothetical protein DSO57_1036468 [Entomophthora muscae]|uniref:Uncharacterized protein n=1 Tax=Entomophthora muscae TaxID=34485 RepID=A0ACC2TAN3_9FUNG|nr:hypothetical protein DSO57_1036468 [Entomophthora muscae]